ncbi:outer membrane beta-barrel protein [Acetobacteraceae bacterium KSS8]|uniref:Outer membrane beta-barrel protein n=1 Tax=Endosaccharibacter trunci TaxID=2812733 RepID=A0ABT1W823_9PROT|nr:outer membrane beta-barrel protein [Acetobacteraceae bacterium KSS8]
MVEHAAARPISGLYVAADGGANFAGSTTASGGVTRVGTQTGPLGLGAVGWGFGNGLRAEIEGSIRSNDIDAIDTLRLNGLRLPLGHVTGHLQTEAGMANLAYDLPLRGFIKPYVIAGIGYGDLDFRHATGDDFGVRLPLPSGNRFTGPVVVHLGSAGAFAYQAGFGLAAAVPGLRALDATIEYRYFGTAHADVPITRTAANTTDLINGAVPSSRTHNRFTLGDNALMVGLRYSFGAL